MSNNLFADRVNDLKNELIVRRTCISDLHYSLLHASTREELNRKLAKFKRQLSHSDYPNPEKLIRKVDEVIAGKTSPDYLSGSCEKTMMRLNEALMMFK
jgi:hypothetical protein